jgi:ATP-dependent Clp protease ATP-binding subunit ClpA
MSTKKVEKMLERAVSFAGDNNHEYITLEHVLLSLLHEKDVNELLLSIGSQPAKIKTDVIAFLSDPSLRKPDTAEMKKIPPKRTSVLQRTFQRALTQEIFSGNKEISNEKVLMSMLSEESSHAYYYLAKNGVTKEKLLEAFRKENDKKEENSDSPLALYARNLNREAADGQIDPVIGRDKEVIDTIEILARRKKNNVVYVGEPGVGKTALAEGLALKIVKKEVPPALQSKTVYSLDIGAMLAGTKFRGDFEERMNGVLKEVKKLGNVIMFIDEIHMILGAGSTSGSTMDASNLLKPMLAKGQLMCVGATTYDEFHEHFEKDKALLRRFQKYDINQPSAEETKLILKGLLKHYEKFHNVTYEEGTTDLCVDLADRYMKSKFFPDKALDILDAAGAKAKLDESKLVTTDTVLEQAAKIARVKKDAIDVKANDTLAMLEPRLKNSVVGQDTALEVVVNSIYLAKAGLREPGKPVGNFLFTGPTGSGKTFTAKQLAKQLGVELVRFDMSEYMEQHTVSKLIGAPPGYVGHGEGKMGEGQLIQQIESHPDCVLLLDEIEKAHPSVFTVLLQVMDDGRLTSSKGKTVDFSNVIIVMSANAGAAMAEKGRIGFGDNANHIAVDEELKKLFSPEFRNRLDAIVKFNKLSLVEMRLIVDAEIVLLQEVLGEKSTTLNVSAEAREFLAVNGLDPKMGARPFKRYFEKNVKLPLSKEMLFGKLTNGGHVFIDLVDGSIASTITPTVDNTVTLENLT